MDMDKDVASAIVLERCNCYDSSLEAAKKALTKEELSEDQLQAARKVVKALGVFYYKQQCLEKILECRHLLEEVSPDSGTPDRSGEEKVEIRADVGKKLYAIFQKVENIPENKTKSRNELLHEAIDLLILKYSADQSIRNTVLEQSKQSFS
ncbi:MAG: hypothetical protein R6X11_05610 [Desulfonatronovibrio sp.]